MIIADLPAFRASKYHRTQIRFVATSPNTDPGATHFPLFLHLSLFAFAQDLRFFMKDISCKIVLVYFEYSGPFYYATITTYYP